MTNKFEAIEKASKGEITIEMRPVYIINGAVRARLTERAALNKLACIITERGFRKDGIPTNEPDVMVDNGHGKMMPRAGKPTEQFMSVKESVYIGLLEKLRQEKEIVRLEKKYQAANEKSQLLLKELIAAQNK
jgi:hypothetical protein